MPERLPLAFLISLGLLATPILILIRTQASLGGVVWVITLVLLALLVLDYFWPKNHAQPQPIQPKRAPPLKYLVPVLFGVAATLLAWGYQAPIGDAGDHWFYLNFIRHYLDHGLIADLNPLVGQAANAGTLLRAGFNAWWALEAVVIRASGLPLMEAYWLRLPPVLMGLSFLAVYGLAKQLFQTQRAALLTVLVQTVYLWTSISSHSWAGNGFFLRIAEDKFLVWFVLLPASLTILVRLADNFRWSWATAMGLSVLALGFTHPLGVFQLAIAAMGFGAVLLGTRAASRKYGLYWIAGAVLLGVFLLPLVFQPLIATPLFAAEGQVPPNTSQTMVLNAFAGRFIAHPHVIAHPLVLLSLLLATLLPFWVRTDRSAPFLLGLTFAPLLAAFHPLVAPLVGGISSPWLVWRVLWVLPTSLVLVFIFEKVLDWLSTRQTRIPGWVPAYLLVLGISFPLYNYFFDSAALLQDQKQRVVPGDEAAVLEALATLVEPGNVVLAEPLVNTHLPAFTSTSQQLSFRIFEARPGVFDEIGWFFNQQQTTRATMMFLHSWEVDFVVVPSTLRFTTGWDGLTDFFQLRFENEAYALYQVFPIPATLDIAYPAPLEGSPPAGAIHPNPGENLLMAGAEFLAAGRYSEALTAYAGVVGHEPDLFRLSGREGFWGAWGRSLTFDRRADRVMEALLGMGAIYEAQGEWDQAAGAYRQIIALVPDRMEGYEGLARAYLATGQDQALLTMFQEAARYYPHLVWPRIKLGEVFLRQGEPERALAELEHARLHDWANPQIYHTLAEVHRSTGEQDKVIALYQEAAANLPWESWPLVALGKIQMEAGDWPGAEKAFLQAVAMNPVRAEAYDQLGRYYLDHQSTEKAVDIYMQALQQNPNQIWPYLGLGNALFASGEVARAAAAYEMVIAFEPQNPEVYLTLGNIFRWDHHLPETAAEYYREGLALAPNRADIYASLGGVLFETGQDEEGMLALDKALQLEPGSSTLHQLAGDMQFHYGLKSRAEPFYLEAIALDSQNVFALIGLARVYRDQQNLGDALAYGMRAAALAAGNHEIAQARFELGQIYWSLGENELARANFIGAISALPGNAEQHATIGDFLRIAENNPQAALPYHLQAVELMPDTPRFLVTLGDTYRALGEEELALEAYHKAGEIDPGYPGLQDRLPTQD